MNRCIDCKIKIDRRSLRCRKCAGIQQSIKNSGKNCRFYIDGHTLKKNFCPECGKKISWNAKKCSSCATIEHGYYSKFKKKYNKCIDCGVNIDPRAKRCISCHYIWLKINPKKIINKNKCIICKKEISLYAKRCNSCAKKEFNKLNPRLKNPKLCYCIDCTKQLSNSSYYLGTKRCNSCELKRRYLLGLKNFKGRNHPRFGKPPNHIKKIKYKNIWMRSSYEIAYAQWLDKQGIKWLYESKTFDLDTTTYTPDFYLPKKDLYIEIKGWFRDKDKEKINNFKSKYLKEKIKVLLKEDLINLGVLK